ncbi:heme-degrading monooxygenase HmoA [Actinoplanes octamycinicus]|uniref:Heme-degrading monooxygenase HmoA n=1 Tax=Actinoplanes octamycinicus TaxID=135948 RepID=A0A7W7GZD7_9ACTN|nr:antibiotic biosynthesis monooxygenase [Actinoplanes octamycinicus]MBB4741126.1 heme-degrading monooxygenase HmoA [Actinoplanes octamycinicus]GIE56033.1 antibiotic biosynthesis monooxygenase [Actinoplanes octamycinicus]
MIARIWRGWAPATTADDYQRHYAAEVAGELRRVPGFRGARLLRVGEGDEVRFTSIVFFAGMDDVRAFAGPDLEWAVVAEPARRALSRWDEHVVHEEVALTITAG